MSPPPFLLTGRVRWAHWTTLPGTVFVSPAVLAPLGAATLVFNALFAKVMVKEPFTRTHLVGTVVIIAGAVVIAIFGYVPESRTAPPSAGAGTGARATTHGSPCARAVSPAWAGAAGYELDDLVHLFSSPTMIGVACACSVLIVALYGISVYLVWCANNYERRHRLLAKMTHTRLKSTSDQGPQAPRGRQRQAHPAPARGPRLLPLPRPAMPGVLYAAMAGVMGSSTLLLGKVAYGRRALPAAGDPIVLCSPAPPHPPAVPAVPCTAPAGWSCSSRRCLRATTSSSTLARTRSSLPSSYSARRRSSSSTRASPSARRPSWCPSSSASSRSSPWCSQFATLSSGHASRRSKAAWSRSAPSLSWSASRCSPARPR